MVGHNGRNSGNPSLVDQVRNDLLNDTLRAKICLGRHLPQIQHWASMRAKLLGKPSSICIGTSSPLSRNMDDPRGGVRHVIPENQGTTWSIRTRCHRQRNAGIREVGHATNAQHFRDLAAYPNHPRGTEVPRRTNWPCPWQSSMQLIGAGDAVTLDSTLRIPLSSPELADRVIASY